MCDGLQTAARGFPNLCNTKAQCVHVHAYHVKFKILITRHETSETLTHEYKIYQQAT